ncbi:MAG: hypothetical protein M1819_003063 [Sarea resinae]|nr:MAG: hypothetical protein M1819_003063 [Sarea resinae]
MEIIKFRHYNREINENQYEIPTTLLKRPATFNTTGKEVTIGINHFNVTKLPTKTVYQYDILIGSGGEKRGLIKRVWESKAVTSAVGPGWIFDGNKIAWSLRDMKDSNIMVDLDLEQGKTPREGREDRHRVVIRKTTPVNLASIDAYLSGKVSFGSGVLEAINFLDHLLRQTPSVSYTSIKRSFFARGHERYYLGGGIEAFKGVYQSIRACHGRRMAVNVDVSNGTFWTESPLIQTVKELANARDYSDLIWKLKQVKGNAAQEFRMVDSQGFRTLRRLKKVGVYAKHRGFEEKEKLFLIDRFTQLNAKEFTFPYKDHAKGTEEDISVYDYFLKKYDIVLQYWELPLVYTTKKGVVFPMECMMVAQNQRYPFKLDEDQTSKMIKFAVTRPKERIDAINHGLLMLEWHEDKYLKNYGLQIDPKMVQTKARVLNNPTVGFQGSEINPGVSGRWDIRGKKFIVGNKHPLKAWGVCIFAGRYKVDKASAGNFIREFIKIYQGHGGVVENKNPIIVEGISDAAKAVEATWNQAGNQANMRPQILLFMVADKNAFHYTRIKKSCDCRFGVVSQVVQNAHVQKCNAQYISNVCMKINAKLGGCTSKVGKKPPTGHFAVPTMIIGADVSHPSPGSDAPSMAAMTVSLDKYCARYAAGCETNGHRVEMITTANIDCILRSLIMNWVTTTGGGRYPTNIFYFRDGVSEGQYLKVINEEVKDIKALINEMTDGEIMPKFIVTVASKRHHIRFFPKTTDRVAADRNGNPVPGTLVERDVTHPFEYDFYLNAHSAIQGTARPVHYHVLMDEAGIPVNEFQNMIYECSYQYMRSTTPVSLFPAVYYAHLASNRARSHENIPASSGPRTGPDAVKIKPKSGSQTSKPPTEIGPLIPLNNAQGIAYDMWFI